MGETSTGERYRQFGEMEARGHSPSYERLCRGIGADAELLAVIDTLPAAKRQPNLLLGAVRPEQHERLARLRAATRIARAEPPRLVHGDLNATIADLAGQAPPDATLVVFHSAVLPYVPRPERDRFAETMRALPARWISNEAPAVLPDVATRLPRAPSTDGSAFVLSLDEEPVAYTGPHGQFLDWLS